MFFEKDNEGNWVQRRKEEWDEGGGKMGALSQIRN
jgi:hypothetical protein